MPSDAEWVELVTKVERVSTWVEQIKENDLPHINTELIWIRNRLNRGYRPPWAIVALVSFLSSLTVASVVFAIMVKA